MEALDALKRSHAREFLMTSMITAVLTPKEQRETELGKVRGDYDESKDELLEERIILLKAKLIQMKTTAAVEEACKDFIERD